MAEIQFGQHRYDTNTLENAKFYLENKELLATIVLIYPIAISGTCANNKKLDNTILATMNDKTEKLEKRIDALKNIANSMQQYTQKRIYQFHTKSNIIILINNENTRYKRLCLIK